MVFVYKINTRYGGLTPRRFVERMTDDMTASVGWRHYIDQVELNDEVWLFFLGDVVPGVYGVATVASVDVATGRVDLRFTEFDPESPVLTGADARRVVRLVTRARRQVFVYEDVPDVTCTALEPGAPSCAGRQCDQCPFFRRLPRVTTHSRPERLDGTVRRFSAGLWTVPPRSYRSRDGVALSPEERAMTALTRAYKSGEIGLAYLYAAAIHQSLSGLSPRLQWQAVVPIPLSPEKQAAGEVDRARAIAVEVSRLVRAPVREVLDLTAPVGKRATLRSGGSIARFAQLYTEHLVVALPLSPSVRRVLLIDDACTTGTTLSVAARALTAAHGVDVDAAVGVLMDVRATAPPPRDVQSLPQLHQLEVLYSDGLSILRWTHTGRVVAWSTTDSTSWRDYCASAIARLARS